MPRPGYADEKAKNLRKIMPSNNGTFFDEEQRDQTRCSRREEQSKMMDSGSCHFGNYSSRINAEFVDSEGKKDLNSEFCDNKSRWLPRVTGAKKTEQQWTSSEGRRPGFCIGLTPT